MIVYSVSYMSTGEFVLHQYRLEKIRFASIFDFANGGFCFINQLNDVFAEKIYFLDEKIASRQFERLKKSKIDYWQTEIEKAKNEIASIQNQSLKTGKIK